MRKTFFRVLCFLTLVAIILSMAMSCAEEKREYEPIDLGKGKGKDTKEHITTRDTADTDWGVQLETGYIYDEIFRNYSFDGDEIIILANGSVCADEIIPADSSSFVSQKIYERNARVAKLLDVKLNDYRVSTSQGVMDRLRSDSMSGEQSYDLVADTRNNVFSAVRDSLLKNLFSIPEVNTGNEYYSQTFIEGANVGGNLFAITGDLSTSYITSTYATYINLNLAQQKDVSDDIFNKVYMGEWTIEYQLGLINEVFDDNNGNGAQDDPDTYGFIANTKWCIDPYMSAFEFAITENKGGDVKLYVDSQKGIIVTQVLNKLFHEISGVKLLSNNMSNEEMAVEFSANTALFMTNNISMYRNDAIGEIEYGILPMPKLDGSQNEYFSYNDSSVMCMSIPVCTQDVKRSAVVMECLFAYSNETVQALIDHISMKQSTEHGRNMLGIIIDGISVDTMLVHTGTVGELGYFMRNIIANGSGDFVTQWSVIQRQTESAVDMLVTNLNSVR